MPSHRREREMTAPAGDSLALEKGSDTDIHGVTIAHTT